MIRLRESTRTNLMLAHGYTMLALGLALFYIRATMTNFFFHVFGSAMALLLVAGGSPRHAACPATKTTPRWPRRPTPAITVLREWHSASAHGAFSKEFSTPSNTVRHPYCLAKKGLIRGLKGYRRGRIRALTVGKS